MIEKILEYSGIIQTKSLPEYKRNVFNKISFNQKLVGLKGAKGVGKTTILLQYLKENSLPLNKKVYVSMDSVMVGGLTLFEIAEQLSQIGVEILVVDEIHYQSGFEKDLKSIYDFLDLKVIFSGSSALQLDLTKADLGRRSLVFDIPILSLREFIEMKKGIELPSYSLEDILSNHYEISREIISKGIKPLECFYQYLKSGCFPYFLESENENDYFLKLSNSISSVLESDLLHIFAINPSNVYKLKKLLFNMCQITPGGFNVNSIAQSLGIDVKTLYNYIIALERGELVSLLYYSKKGNALFQKPDKVLLGNPNLFYVLCDKPDIGSIREAFFVSMVRVDNSLKYAKHGDFAVNDKFVFEIGGKSKKRKQIKDIPEGFVVVDGVEFGSDKKIPLWVFGFLY